MRELLFKTAAADELGVDPRRLANSSVEPVGVIKIRGRECPVYDKAGIERIKRAMEEIRAS